MKYNDHTPIDSEPRIAITSRMMFAPGDRVRSKNPKYPFWMTVKSVNERTGFYLCHFVYSGNLAGNFRESELEFGAGNVYSQ